MADPTRLGALDENHEGLKMSAGCENLTHHFGDRALHVLGGNTNA